jgi:hypothetical protein
MTVLPARPILIDSPSAPTAYAVRKQELDPLSPISHGEEKVTKFDFNTSQHNAVVPC